MDARRNIGPEERFREKSKADPTARSNEKKNAAADGRCNEKKNGAADGRTTKSDPLETFDPSIWEGQPVPPRVWTVENLIPSRSVTMLNGDGGIGKTLLSLQLAASAASHGYWLGLATRPGRVLGVFCEDEEDELHRRLVDIAASMNCRLADLADFRLVSRVGKDNALVSFDRRNHRGKTTPLFDEIANTAKHYGCNIVEIDALHDVFEGDEINRSEARQFIGHLRRIAVAIDGAVVLNAHPSQYGMQSGSGTSGSTAWNNASRSRLYLTRPKGDENGEADDSIRVLQTKKSNYGPLNADIELKWEHGVFVRAVMPGDPFHQGEAAFLECLDQTTRQGRPVSEAKSSTRYAPKIFATMKQHNRKCSVRRLALAMEALFASNSIRVGDARGGDRHPVRAIERVPR